MNIAVWDSNTPLGNRTLYLWAVFGNDGRRLAFGCGTSRKRAEEDAADAERRLADGRRRRTQTRPRPQKGR